jgi:hypothetical protein
LSGVAKSPELPVSFIDGFKQTGKAGHFVDWPDLLQGASEPVQVALGQQANSDEAFRHKISEADLDQ